MFSYFYSMQIDWDKMRFFESAVAFRQWLDHYHNKAEDIWVGFYKKSSGREGITYHGALDEALCYGWIDGIRKSLDDTSYTIRFTPRKKGSIWSLVNMKRVEELKAMELMHPSGLEAFSRRKKERTGIYSFEQAKHELGENYEKQFRQHAPAWEFFQAQAPTYKKVATWWVISAKQEATRLKRLELLISDSAQGKRLKQFVSPTKKKV